MHLTIILPTDAVHNVEVTKDASVAELMIQLKVRLSLYNRLLLLDIKHDILDYTNAAYE